MDVIPFARILRYRFYSHSFPGKSAEASYCPRALFQSPGPEGKYLLMVAILDFFPYLPYMGKDHPTMGKHCGGEKEKKTSCHRDLQLSTGELSTDAYYL